MKQCDRQLDRTLLILDLDEMLIYATETPLERSPDFCVYGYNVYRRPYLAEFLARALSEFDVAVWSSASDDYVVAVVSNIFGDHHDLQFVWGRSRATLRRTPQNDDSYFYDPWDHTHYVKPLTKVRRRGWRLERVLIVDDTPEKCVRNYGNAIHPQPYSGESGDMELELLSLYLSGLKDEPNVRRIEKRRWRDQVKASVA